MEESTKSVGMADETPTTEAHLTTNGREAVGAEVRCRGALEPCPQAFDQVELGGIGGKAMYAKPCVLGLDVGAGLEAAVCVQTVPEQDDRSADVTPQVPKEAHDLGRANRARMGHQEDAGAPGRSHAVGQGADDREVAPTAKPVGQDRRLPARRPGPADRRPLGEAALVDEDDRCSAARGVLFSAGQFAFTQRWIASSSRSRARVVGFCSDQPSWRITRHTWPGW